MKRGKNKKSSKRKLSTSLLNRKYRKLKRKAVFAIYHVSCVTISMCNFS